MPKTGPTRKKAGGILTLVVDGKIIKAVAGEQNERRLKLLHEHLIRAKCQRIGRRPQQIGDKRLGKPGEAGSYRPMIVSENTAPNCPLGPPPASATVQPPARQCRKAVEISPQVPSYDEEVGQDSQSLLLDRALEI